MSYFKTKSNIKTLLFFLFVFHIFTGCLEEEGGGQERVMNHPEESGVPGDPDIKDPDEILKNCEDAQTKGYMEEPMTVTIVFADTKVESGRSEVCEFNENGNLHMDNDFLMARYEQVKALELPEGADLCDLEFSMDIQQLKYDDIFYLTLNDRVLASNHRATVEGLEAESIDLPDGSLVPLYKYDWESLVGQPFHNGNLDDFCFGEQEGYAQCQWPETEQTGDFFIEYDRDLLVHMGAKSKNHQHAIQFVVTGDDNPAIDCYHEEFSFVLRATYYLR